MENLNSNITEKIDKELLESCNRTGALDNKVFVEAENKFYLKDDLKSQTKLEKLYTKAKESLVDFYRIFLADKDKYKEPAEFHYEISNILLNNDKHFAIQAFRESGKTELTIRTYCLYQLLYRQGADFYIMIIKNSSSESAKHIRQIAETFKSNPLISFRTEKIIQETSNEGGAFEVLLKGNVRIRIEGKGKGSSLRGAVWFGRRPDIVIIDDPQDIEDSFSETTLEKDWDWFLSDVMYLSKSGRIFVIGNNLGEKCLIERIIENKDNLGFETMKIPVRYPDGKLAWETQYTNEEIEEIIANARKIGKLDVVMRELFCESMPEEYKTFKREDFQYFDLRDTKKLLANTNKYLLVDLAISEKQTADYTALVVAGINPENHLFVFDIVYGRFNPSEVIDNIFKLVQKYDIIKVGVEKVAYQAAIEHFLYKEMPKRNVFFEIEPLIADKQKELRIKTLQPRFKAKTVWFPKDADWLPELETELLTFPKGKHDDLIDALAYIEQISDVPIHSKFNQYYEELPSWSAW